MEYTILAPHVLQQQSSPMRHYPIQSSEMCHIFLVKHKAQTPSVPPAILQDQSCPLLLAIPFPLVGTEPCLQGSSTQSKKLQGES